MPPTSTLFRSARPIFQSRVRSTFFTPHFQNSLSRFTARTGRRFQSTEAPTAEAASKSWFSRMWNSPIGLKTVHFWAPVMKWALVLAGVSDFYRPADKLSLTQNIALTATGAIWTRWCLIIKPKNYLLAAVNFFLGCVGVIQVSRIFAYQQSIKGKTPVQKLETVKDNAEVTAEAVKDDVKSTIAP